MSTNNSAGAGLPAKGLSVMQNLWNRVVQELGRSLLAV